MCISQNIKAKVCYLFKLLISQKYLFISMNISTIRMKIPCVIIHKQDSQNA